MLPGFRFLFAAIVMCMSVLVFGLGAAALFRAAHEDFASNPTWRAPPEPHFAQQDEKTVLAVLSIQPPIEPQAALQAATAGPTAGQPAPESQTPEPQTTAASSPMDPVSPSEATKPATSTVGAAPAPSSPVESAAPTFPAEAGARVPANETKVAAIEDEPSAPAEQAPPSVSAPVQFAAQPTTESGAATLQSAEAATRIATLGGPPVMTEEIAAARASDPKLDRSEVNKRLRAEHARDQRRRRLAAFRRARLEQQAAASLLFTQNPFTPHPLVGPPPTPAR